MNLAMLRRLVMGTGLLLAIGCGGTTEPATELPPTTPEAASVTPDQAQPAPEVTGGSATSADTNPGAN